jgi:hypothetical protein
VQLRDQGEQLMEEIVTVSNEYLSLTVKKLPNGQGVAQESARGVIAHAAETIVELGLLARLVDLSIKCSFIALGPRKELLFRFAADMMNGAEQEIMNRAALADSFGELLVGKEEPLDG